jgi:pimeloyl-[acyl-carrier protein] methyl ester esterase
MPVDKRAAITLKKQLILIHGWGINKAIWSQLQQVLQDDINIIAIDLPGYGKNDHLPIPYTVKSLATTIAPYIDKAEQSIILGWSMGGLVAIELAKLYPQKISQLILVASNPKFVQAADWSFAVEKQVFINFANELKKDIKKTIRRFIAIQAMGSPTAKEDIKTIFSLIEQQPYANYDSLNKGLDILLSADQRNSLLSLTMPVLMIAGDKDSLVKVDALQYLCEQQLNPQNNNLSLQVIEGAGHAPFISHFDVFELLIRKYLGINS